jgi:ATP phosphoribosyltransferase regulatory subunit
VRRERAVNEGVPRSLEHPLPAGMRDLLPVEAASRRLVARAVLERFALFGYRVVTPPAFELGEVIERGLGPLAASDVLRFVEPESGEVCVLRPDVTPQIARIVATRLRDQQAPLRLAYEGTVMRRKMGRAKKHRQIPQVGVELCGLPAAEGDLELLEVAVDAVRGAGLERFTIDLSDAGIVRELLRGVPDDRAKELTSALAKKDEVLLVELGADPALVALTHLSGGRDAIVEAVRLLAGGPAEAPARRLLALIDAAAARGLGDVITADAGEVRGFAYYTGAIFSIYAEGPGEPIGGGGRYDALLERFGHAMPAAGFGLDLDALSRALRSAGHAPAPLAGVVVVGPPDDARLRALRARQVPAVAVQGHEAARAYARAWGFAHVWDDSSLIAVDDGAAVTLCSADVEGAAEEAVRVVRTEPRGGQVCRPS